MMLQGETEWVETLANRCNVLAGAARERIVEAARSVSLTGPWEAVYGDGDASNTVADAPGKASDG